MSQAGLIVALSNFSYTIFCPLVGYLAIKLKNNKLIFFLGLLFTGIAFLLLGPNHNVLYLP